MVQTWIANRLRTTGGRPEDRVRVYIENGITTGEALQGAVSVTPERCNQAAATHMGKILRECGLIPRMVRVATTGSCSRIRKYFMPSQMSQVVTSGDEPAVTPPDSQLSLMSQVSQVSQVTHYIRENKDSVVECKQEGGVDDQGKGSKTGCVACDDVTGQIADNERAPTQAIQPADEADCLGCAAGSCLVHGY